MKFGLGPKSLKKWIPIGVFLIVALLLYHDPFILLWWPQKPAENPKNRLDMATDSIDDMCDGCRPDTANLIDLFGVFEWHINTDFSLAWSLAEEQAKEPAHEKMTKDHSIVVYMYTGMLKIQQNFDQAVKAGKHKYNTNGFRFHYFYFYLKDAIQVLRLNQTSCRTTYHRTSQEFDHSVLNTNMRFGAFTWVSLDKQSFLLNANVSCFEIHSCFGADITDYSAVNLKGQVLIPPYEVFKITEVLTNDPWCNVVYKLQSTKIPRTDLNCMLSNRSIKTYFTAALTLWEGNSLIGACIILLVLNSIVLIKHREVCFVAAVLGSLLVFVIILTVFKVNQSEA